MKFQRHSPFRPSRGQPYDRRIYKRTEREPHTKLQLVTLYTPFRRQLLSLIRKHPGISYRGLARLTGRHDSRIRDNVRHFIAARLVYVVKEPYRNYLYLDGVKHTHKRTQRPTQIGHNTRLVLEYMRERGESTRQAIIRDLSLSRHQAYRAMNELERRGVIRQLRRVTIAKIASPA